MGGCGRPSRHKARQGSAGDPVAYTPPPRVSCPSSASPRRNGEGMCEAPNVASKVDLKRWILEAIELKGGSATVTEVAKDIWEHHEAELRASGDLFFTWQYDMRWAAQSLRGEGKLAPSPRGTRGWSLPK